MLSVLLFHGFDFSVGTVWVGRCQLGLRGIQASLLDLEYLWSETAQNDVFKYHILGTMIKNKRYESGSFYKVKGVV